MPGMTGYELMKKIKVLMKHSIHSTKLVLKFEEKKLNAGITNFEDNPSSDHVIRKHSNQNKKVSTKTQKLDKLQT